MAIRYWWHLRPSPGRRSALRGWRARFPYRVGRESRGTQRSADGFVTERRSPGSRPTNDLYLGDTDEALNVSRAHFQIERADAAYTLVDRESTCGTIVEGEVVGGDTGGGTIALHDGDVIVVGTAYSPYVFKFRG